eukprot:3000991-Pleurochrysis_carterae.AAC.2
MARKRLAENVDYAATTMSRSFIYSCDQGYVRYDMGVHTNGELLPSTHMAIIRLYWRHVDAAMTRLKFDKELSLSTSFKWEFRSHSTPNCWLTSTHSQFDFTDKGTP